jgi:sn-glycerol 3-phosphate transport system permease protein
MITKIGIALSSGMVRPRLRLYPRKIIAYSLLCIMALVTLVPIFLMFLTSFKSAGQLDRVIPSRLTLFNYAYVLKTIPLWSMTGNTVLMALLQSLLQVATGLLGSWAFFYWKRFPLRGFIFALVTLTWLIPFQATLIPNYVLISRLGWLNSMAGLVVPHIASTFALLWIYQSMKGFPNDLLDMGKIDGIGSSGMLWRLVTPNIQATLISLGIFSFIGSWNEYFWPLLVTRKMERTVLQIGLQMFQGAETGDAWGPIMSCATMVSLPVLCMYIFLQKKIIESFLHSGFR